MLSTSGMGLSRTEIQTELNHRSQGGWRMLLAAVGVSAALAGCGEGGEQPGEGGEDGATNSASAEETDEPEQATIPVEAATVSRGSISASWRGSATIEADAQANVVARVGGIVRELLVEEGDVVEEGQALARLDDDQLQLEVQQAKANMDKLTANFDRSRAVFSDGIISRESFDQIRFDLQNAKATYDLARLRLRYSTIRSPITGIVTQRMIKVGNLIQTSAPAFQVTRFDPLLAVLHVPEREIHKLSLDQTARLRFDAYPDDTFTGQIARINPLVDASTGTVKTTVEMQPDDRLRPGMFGRVLIFYDRHDDAVLVPGEAIVTEDARDAVFVIANGKASRREIVTGFTEDRMVEVLQGLEGGERVVTKGQASLSDEAPVLVIGDPVEPAGSGEDAANDDAVAEAAAADDAA